MFEGSIFTVVLGMSSGLTVQQWTQGKVETVCQMSIPWAIEWVSGHKNIYWPSKWLKNVVEMVNFYAKSGDIISWAMPGADLAFVEKYRLNMTEEAYRLALPILNYQSLADEVIFQEISKSVDPRVAYLKMHGANWAFFQSPVHIAYYQKKLQKYPDIQVVPLADWITYLAMGATTKIAHDPTMLQSMGAYGIDTRDPLYAKLFGKDLAGRIFPFDVSKLDEVFITADGIRIVPCSHDSVYARRIGFSKCPSGIWTGTWVGTSDWIGGKDIKPSGRTFDAGIAFEGLGSLRALITNISMAGAIYKAIVQKFGWSYEEASKEVVKVVYSLGDRVAFIIDRLPGDTDVAAKFIIEKALNDGVHALAYLLLSLAVACRQKKELVYKILRRKVPKEVAVFGGFSENIAFLQALKNFGFEPIVPPFAANATHAGLAIEALTRTGEADDDREALAMLQTSE